MDDHRQAAAWLWQVAKLLLPPVLIGASVAGVGFLLSMPKTMREAFVRVACSVGSSCLVGPFAVVLLWQWRPAWFASATGLAAQLRLPSEVGYLVLASPVLAMTALPAWFVVGVIWRFFERRKNQDAAELIHDIAVAVHDARKAL